MMIFGQDRMFSIKTELRTVFFGLFLAMMSLSFMTLTGCSSSHNDNASEGTTSGGSGNGSGGFAGHSDWRLPNIKELKSIAELRCREPALNTTLFFNPGSIYWSSTLDISKGERAWVVFFSSGSDYFFDRTQSHNVRLVRDATP